MMCTQRIQIEGGTARQALGYFRLVGPWEESQSRTLFRCAGGARVGKDCGILLDKLPSTFEHMPWLQFSNV